MILLWFNRHFLVVAWYSNVRKWDLSNGRRRRRSRNRNLIYYNSAQHYNSNRDKYEMCIADMTR